MSSLTAPPRAHRISLIVTEREDPSVCDRQESPAVPLRFDAVGSVVKSLGFREKTSINRRTISLQPPLDGQQMSIFGFFFEITDDVIVGDWSVEAGGVGIGLRMSINPLLDTGKKKGDLPVEALGRCRWWFEIFLFREVLDTCRSSLECHRWHHTSWKQLRWSRSVGTHCTPRSSHTLILSLSRLDLLGNISRP